MIRYTRIPNETEFTGSRTGSRTGFCPGPNRGLSLSGILLQDKIGTFQDLDLGGLVVQLLTRRLIMSR
jgi:hypothetical protein